MWQKNEDKIADAASTAAKAFDRLVTLLEQICKPLIAKLEDEEHERKEVQERHRSGSTR